MLATSADQEKVSAAMLQRRNLPKPTATTAVMMRCNHIDGYTAENRRFALVMAPKREETDGAPLGMAAHVECREGWQVACDRQLRPTVHLSKDVSPGELPCRCRSWKP